MALRRLKPITQSHYLVSSPSLPDAYFSEFSGIKEKKQTSKYPDGVRRRMYTVAGMVEIEDVTISVEFDPRVHRPILAAYERLRDNEQEIKLSVVPVDSSDDPRPVGEGFNLFGCLVTGVEVAQANRSSADTSKLVITIAPGEYTRS
ncbi:MAG: phage tail protein [Plectolyngbya sp. WJT66-NPBG17]|nr:phage tail protein [Plectolyngbya sp. WJT66-NPBG17]